MSWSVTRVLGPPLVGLAAGYVVLDATERTLAKRTHQVTDSLHGTSRSLRQLAEVDDTQDLLKKMNIAPETVELANEVGDTKKTVKDAMPAAYRRPDRPSLTDQIKSRWNDNLMTVSHALSEADVDKIFTSISSGTSIVYAKVTGQAIPAVAERLESGAPKFASSLRALSPNAAQAAATLREPLPPRPDPRLAAPNTYYLGQGTSLR